MKSRGHTVLITGGATGIGFALAKVFHQSQNQVIIVGRRESALKKAATALPGVLYEQADISLAEDRQKLVARYPNISVLVNNAGIQLNGSFSDGTETEISNELAVNLEAPLLLTHAFLPHLLKQDEAAIVNVSSGLGIVPKENAAVYCASKAAIRQFTKVLGWQLESSSVQVFDLVPSLVDTAMTAGRGEDKISPDRLAEEFWRHYVKNKSPILIGKTKLLSLISRLFPTLADRVMR